MTFFDSYYGYDIWCLNRKECEIAGLTNAYIAVIEATKPSLMDSEYTADAIFDMLDWCETHNRYKKF